MPASFSKNNSKDLAVITLNGDVPINEFLNLFNEYKNSGYSKYEIYDLQEYTANPLSFDEIITLANYFYDVEALRPKGSKTALIHNSSDHLRFGISRQLIALLEREKVHFEINAFYSVDKAFQWLSTPS